jgi:[ribosomal protein S5]-alanine N-acetyltransferase
VLPHEERYRALLLDPDVSRWLGPSPGAPLTRSEADSWLAGDLRHWEERGFGPCLLCDRADDSFVGRGGLRWTEVAGERCVELTYALVSERWGQGLATEAARAALSWAQRLGLIELVALTLPANLASRLVNRILSKRYWRSPRVNPRQPARSLHT